MKKTLMTVIVAMTFMTALAQGADTELNQLIQVVKLLRVQTEANFTRATQILTADQKWTPMNETGRVRDEECKASDKVEGFKLNRVLSKVEKGRKTVATHGDMLNGEDERYDYSLYERALKPGKSATYTLKGREGRQTFVIVPFSAAAKGLSATATIAGKKYSAKPAADGTITIVCDTKALKRSQNFQLTVTNGNKSAAQSFVIINHNTRNK